MGSMPLCLRFGRLVLDNASFINKVSNPQTARMCNFKSTALLNMSRAAFFRHLMNFTAAEGRNPVRGAMMNSTVADGRSANQSDAQPEVASEQEIRKQLDLLSQEVETLTKQNNELTDKYKRALAENENMRTRLVKQIEDAKLFGIQGFCKDLVEVADVLGKATECVPKEEVSDRNPHLKSLFEGLSITEAQLRKVFKRHGLEEVNPINETFDPNMHEALFQQEVEGKQPGTIVVVSKTGYKLHERVIRPALVGVAKG